MGNEHDKVSVSIEIIDDFVDGGTDRTKVEKDAYVVSGISTQLDEIVNIFVNTLIVYGFRKESILNNLQDYIDYEND